MKKDILLRALFGAPIGLAISTLITIAISAFVGDGLYHPVVPELAAACGGELNAVLAQAACSLLYGAGWGAASVIWQLESWSLLRRSAVHLIVCSAVTFPIAYLMRWMRHSIGGVLAYFGIFFAVYVIIWLAQYAAIRRQIRQMNDKMRDRHG